MLCVAALLFYIKRPSLEYDLRGAHAGERSRVRGQHRGERGAGCEDARVEARCAGHGLELISPSDAARRGAQVSFTHPAAGYAIISALIADGVIGDFRAPDILRFGFAPLYTRFVDVWHAVDRLAGILDGRHWDRPKFHARQKVT